MIQIQNISYKYAGADSLVFDGLSLSLEENRIYGLLGRNGVGKSTLLYLMAGLLRPAKGTILIDGREPRRREPDLDLFRSRRVHVPLVDCPSLC